MKATILKFQEKGGMFSKVVENDVKEEKLLVMSNFSLSENVLNRVVLQTLKNKGLFRKDLKDKIYPRKGRNEILHDTLQSFLSLKFPSILDCLVRLNYETTSQ